MTTQSDTPGDGLADTKAQALELADTLENKPWIDVGRETVIKVLRALAQGEAAQPAAEPVAWWVHDFHIARQPVKAKARFPEPTEYLYPASREQDPKMEGGNERGYGPFWLGLDRDRRSSLLGRHEVYFHDDGVDAMSANPFYAKVRADRQADEITRLSSELAASRERERALERERDELKASHELACDTVEMNHAACQAAEAEVKRLRRETIEECAKVADTEAAKRYEQSKAAKAGSQEWGDPKAATIAQGHKAVTAAALATAIRALADANTQGGGDAAE